MQRTILRYSDHLKTFLSLICPFVTCSIVTAVMWLENQNDESLIDQPSAVFNLVHWNFIGNGTKVNLRITTARKGEATSNEKVESPIIDLKCDSHPDDKRLYETNFRLWRYKFENSHDVVVGNDDCWVSFFALSEFQKRAVKRKFSCLINLVIWSRWPEAVVEFEGKPPVIK